MYIPGSLWEKILLRLKMLRASPRPNKGANKVILTHKCLLNWPTASITFAKVQKKDESAEKHIITKKHTNHIVWFSHAYTCHIPGWRAWIDSHELRSWTTTQSQNRSLLVLGLWLLLVCMLVRVTTNSVTTNDNKNNWGYHFRKLQQLQIFAILSDYFDPMHRHLYYIQRMHACPWVHEAAG